MHLVVPDWHPIIFLAAHLLKGCLVILILFQTQVDFCNLVIHLIIYRFTNYKLVINNFKAKFDKIQRRFGSTSFKCGGASSITNSFGFIASFAHYWNYLFSQKKAMVSNEVVWKHN